MRRVDFVTNIAPHYRTKLWLKIAAMEDYEVNFCFGRNAGSTIREISFDTSEWSNLQDRLNILRNRLINGVLFWQSGAVSRSMRTDADIAVLLGDMNVLSNWLAALILRLRRRHVVFWGHGIYGNESWLKRFLRLRFLRLASVNLVYGDRARRLLVAAGLDRRRVAVIYNSLDHDTQRALRSSSVQSDFYPQSGFFEDSKRPVLIFVGRLTRQKKLDQLFDALRSLNAGSAKFNLVLVGDGPESARLKGASRDLDGAVRFLGSCYEEETLARLIANADLCVAPGEIGLTAIHSLSYGTPACTHGDMSRQMPEAEAIREGVTGCFFDDGKRGLPETIQAWFDSDHSRSEIRANCYRIVDEQYNPDVQCRILSGVLRDL